MNLLANDIIERFYTFLWPMLRISALLMSAPIFSLRALNVRMRILLADPAMAKPTSLLQDPTRWDVCGTAA